jgi:hypothetical protein
VAVYTQYTSTPREACSERPGLTALVNHLADDVLPPLLDKLFALS